MKPDELIVCRFLESMKIGLVEHEPDGNVTPDFLIDGKIAVEARRLNQNYMWDDGSVQGFESVEISMWHRMRKLLRDFGPSIDGECWYVHVEFQRPLDWHSIISDITAQLLTFKNSNRRTSVNLKSGGNFKLSLTRASKDWGTFFLLATGHDANSGGNVYAEVARNLRICIAEKEKKVAPFRHNYAKWWLVLVNYVDPNMAVEDYQTFCAQPDLPITHTFDRLLLVDLQGKSIDL